MMGLVIRPGDVLVIRVDHGKMITAAHADAIRQKALDLLPSLADVVVIVADGIDVFRHLSEPAGGPR